MGVTPLMAEALGHLVPWEAAPVSHVPRLIGMTLSSHVPIWVITCLFQESGERGGGRIEHMRDEVCEDKPTIKPATDSIDIVLTQPLMFHVVTHS